MAPMEPQIVTIGKVIITRTEYALEWDSPIDKIDGDGCPTCYHLDGGGLDYLANAYKVPNKWIKRDGVKLPNPDYHEWNEPGFRGWAGVVTDDGTPTGKPVRQQEGDVAPGFLVSPTALRDPTKPRTVQASYVDSQRVAYIAIPPELRDLGAQLGGFGYVALDGASVPVIVADIGPHKRLGEVSIATADMLPNVDSSPRNGGTSRVGHFCVYLNSALKPAWPVAPADIATNVLKHTGSAVTR